MATRPAQYPRWAGTGVKTQPTAAQQSQGWGVGQKPPAQVDNWWKDLADQWVEYFDALMSLAMFGDGSDGAAVLDGTNTVPWATKVGNVYTMIRDAQLTDLTVTGAGVELRLGSSAAQTNFRLFGQGTLTTVGGAIITANGGNGANPGSASGSSTFAPGIAASSCGGGTAGGPGGSTTGTAGSAAFFAAGGAGGAGGAGSAGAGAAGGAITVAAATSAANSGLHFYSGPHLFGYALGGGLGTLFTGNQGYVTPILGGTGGGGGGGGSVGNGGGGGGGGGILAIAFRTIALANATDLQAKGGNGGSNSGTNDGGGGGGGGGVIFLVYLSFTIVGGGSLSAAVNCAGGAGGAQSAGTGGPGLAGANGAIYAQNYGGGSAAALPTTHVEKGVINMATGGSGAGFDFGVASFSANFSVLPGSPGGYVPQVTLTPTDAAAAAPGFKITFALNQMTITPVEQFNGIISWRAEL